MSILVIDVGTSSLRAAIVEPDASVHHVHHVPFLPESPFPGLVEFDARAMADHVLQAAHATLEAHGRPVTAVGIANQRTSSIVWDRTTGEPIGPGLGWQDLRTVMTCLELAGKGFRLAPNQSPTKLAWLLDTFDAARARDVCVGTVDSWITWVLTGGRHHVTDLTNAAISGLMRSDASGWHTPLLAELRIPEASLPVVVDSSGVVGEATALPGAPPIAGIAGDQQAALIGQGCVHPGQAKITFGTGAMLDIVVGPDQPGDARGPAGTFPIVVRARDGRATWGLEAIMLSAGTNVEWLRDDLGILRTAAESHEVASACHDTGGVMYVPALLGLGTPWWDYGARGTLVGLTRGTGRPELVRAVLEGVAHRGADLVEAAERDAGMIIGTIRIDGGMAANPTFVQALADAAQKPVEVSPVLEATTLGAAFLAGLAVGTWSDLDEIALTWRPAATVTPTRVLDRARWAEACRRAREWVPELSVLDF